MTTGSAATNSIPGKSVRVPPTPTAPIATASGSGRNAPSNTIRPIRAEMNAAGGTPRTQINFRKKGTGTTTTGSAATNSGTKIIFQIAGDEG